jgi:endoglucanase
MMQKLGAGINIGNTLEATPGHTVHNHMDTETSWGTARIEPWHFEAIKEKGFTNVRIPITWENHMDENLIIYEDWMDRIQECVDMALAEGLYVTINTHHEGSFYDLMHEGSYTDTLHWLTTVWAQIAERFKDYPAELIFEPMNEPRPGAEGWYWDYNRFRNEIPVLSKTADKLNHDILAFIRTTGGNNDKRIIALTITQADPNLIYLYNHPNDPYTMLGVFMYPDGGKTDRKSENNALEQIKTALAKNIPVVIKETSPHGINNEDDSLKWTRYIFEELYTLGVPSMWWNCGGTGMDELFDRHTGEWNHAQVEAYLASFGTVPGPDVPAPPPPAFPYDLKGPFVAGEFTDWRPDSRLFKTAEKVVVEHTGVTLSGYGFAMMTAGEWEWKQFDNGDKRIKESRGLITFDIRGLEFDTLHFAAWDKNDAAKIKRIYLE